MQGLMQDYPLTLPHFFDRAERLFPTRTIVTATADRPRAHDLRRVGGAHPPARRRARRRSASPPTAGSPRSAGTRPATSSCTSPPRAPGRVLHTLNIRLFPEQLTYIVNHAEDEVIFVDRSLRRPAVAAAADRSTTVRHLVVMDDGKGDLPATPARAASCTTTRSCWPRPSRSSSTSTTRTGPRRCATRAAPPATPRVWSTATGRRSCTPSAVMTADVLGVSRDATPILPVVPMFHANAWGLAHAGVAAGANLVMPGADLSPPALADLIETEQVTVAAGVPTIWMGVLPELEGPRHRPPCGPSRAAARPCPRRCRRATASRPACRSCRPGA